jgi:hypothetical protein
MQQKRVAATVVEPALEEVEAAQQSIVLAYQFHLQVMYTKSYNPLAQQMPHVMAQAVRMDLVHY